MPVKQMELVLWVLDVNSSTTAPIKKWWVVENNWQRCLFVCLFKKKTLLNSVKYCTFGKLYNYALLLQKENNKFPLYLTGSLCSIPHTVFWGVDERCPEEPSWQTAFITKKNTWRASINTTASLIHFHSTKQPKCFEVLYVSLLCLFISLLTCSTPWSF